MFNLKYEVKKINNINGVRDSIIPFLISTILFTIIFWPYLWENPSNLINSFKSMSDYEWKGLVFFESKYYSAQYLPWYYLPKTILITTPFYIFYFLL